MRKGRARPFGGHSLWMAEHRCFDSGRDGCGSAASAGVAARTDCVLSDAGHDLVIGSRYVAGGRLGDWNPMRKLLSAAAVWVTWPIQRSGLFAQGSDVGFFHGAARMRGAGSVSALGFKLLLEILVRGRIRSMEEIPLVFGLRNRGASKASFKVAVDYAGLLPASTRMIGLRRD